MDAKTLFQEGVVAIRDQKDLAKGRELLMQSLKIEPKNEMAWLWLSRTIAEPEKKIQCLERALKLNPANEQTKALISKLATDVPPKANGSSQGLLKAASSTKFPPTSKAPVLEKTDTGSNWGSLREENTAFSSSMKPEVTAEMEDMGLTPDIGALLSSANMTKSSAKPTPRTREANKPESTNWDSLRVSTDEMNAVSSGGLKPQVTAEMEDMGLTPDLGAVITATSEMRAATKRATNEFATANSNTATGTGIKDLRAVYGEEAAPEVQKAKPRKLGPTAAEATQIKNYLTQAQALLNKNKTEEAIEQWVRVLEIEIDNEAALSNAVRYLSRLKYIDDARELVWNALESGTTHPSIYLTAIDIAKYQGKDGEADELRLKLVQLPEAGEKTVMMVVEYFVENQPQKALEALDLAIPLYPKSQKLTFRRAELAEAMGLRKEAATYYEEAAQLGTSSKEGQLADKKLTEFLPHMSDKERGSIGLAIREALGVGFLFLLMAFQDAGLNLMQLGISRVAGIIMSIIGGYLLVTATSSPQQKPLAGWFGGSVPVKAPKPKDEKEDVVKAVMGEPEDEETQLPIIPPAVRIVLAVAGVVVLIAAFVLVYSAAIALLKNGSKPFYVPTIEDLIKDQ